MDGVDVSERVWQAPSTARFRQWRSRARRSFRLSNKFRELQVILDLDDGVGFQTTTLTVISGNTLTVSPVLLAECASLDAGSTICYPTTATIPSVKHSFIR
jgi:hypothetical protein